MTVKGPFEGFEYAGLIEGTGSSLHWICNDHRKREELLLAIPVTRRCPCCGWGALSARVFDLDRGREGHAQSLS